SDLACVLGGGLIIQKENGGGVSWNWRCMGSRPGPRRGRHIVRAAMSQPSSAAGCIIDGLRLSVANPQVTKIQTDPSLTALARFGAMKKQASRPFPLI